MNSCLVAMTSNFLFIIFSIYCSSIVSAQPSPFGFKLQFIGKNRYVSSREENSRTFCKSIECLKDADILFTRASQYEASDPCRNFANFSLGTAIDVGPPSDRDQERSFQREIHEKLIDRIRRVYSAKISPTDGKVVTLLKIFYKDFLKSDHAFRVIRGHKAFIDYATLLGGSPYLSHHLAWNPFMFDKSEDFGILRPKNSSALEMDLWDEKSFSFQRIVDYEPEHFLKFFFDMQLKRCKIPRQNSFKLDEILCLDIFSYLSGFDLVGMAYKAQFENIEGFYSMLEVMNDHYIAGLHGKKELREKMFDPVIKKVEFYLESRKRIWNKFSEENMKVIKIRELQEISKNLNFNIDWLKLINLQLFDKYQVTQDDQILVKDLNLLKELIENLAKTPKR